MFHGFCQVTIYFLLFIFFGFSNFHFSHRSHRFEKAVQSWQPSVEDSHFMASWWRFCASHADLQRFRRAFPAEIVGENG